ncbi:FAD-dependent oxidoreductase [Litorimonas sp. RW-G-Af-16]|uniref:FAD-dependent oxidoreductase n=1 Tax=Litorimonas sp. RW-G-Af-16 TaxID=3241168 RepID=UPI00390CD371
MKICVLGAGVIGVSTAYALGRLGHDVSVIDKAADVSMGASHANGAQLSYSYIDPLASPDTLRKLPTYLLGRDNALQLKFKADMAYMRWGMSFLRNCTSARFDANRKARQALAELSSAALESFKLDAPSELKPTGHGKLVLAQDTADFDKMKQDDGFVSYERCLEIEPSLTAWQGNILGGIYAKQDYALNPITYCKTLKTLSEQKFGVTYYFGEIVSKILSKNKRIAGIETDQQYHAADMVVVCLGNEALPLLKPLGIAPRVYSAQGYSLTLKSKKSSPRTSVTDLKNKIVYANLGQEFRIAGFVDVNQRPNNIEARLELLLQTARKSWPDAADFDGPIAKWTGARPMMPSGVPVIGEALVEGLYLNIGHGSLGYTFAAGSAMKIANMIGHAQTNMMAKQGGHNAA